MRRARPLGRRWALPPVPLAVPFACLVAAALVSLGDDHAEGAEAPAGEADVALGSTLYATQCAGCHGVDHAGVAGRGPSLLAEGAASADFVLRTGRMPLASPTMQAQRTRVRYSELEIRALVTYLGLIGTGADIPAVDTSGGDVAEGGELYRLNCAACHVASLAGAPIGGGRQAPNLTESTPTQIAEAMLIGPGAMPVFGAFEAKDVDSIAAYIEALSTQNTTGTSSFGGAGPVAEGLAAWLLILVPLVALTRWIGSPRAGRNPAHITEPSVGTAAPRHEQPGGER